MEEWNERQWRKIKREIWDMDWKFLMLERNHPVNPGLQTRKEHILRVFSRLISIVGRGGRPPPEFTKCPTR